MRDYATRLPAAATIVRVRQFLRARLRGGPPDRRLRIMLLCTAFNGLTQRAWIELREAGHDVQVQLATDPDLIRAAVMAMDPDLVICPYLRERVPAEVWSAWPTMLSRKRADRDADEHRRALDDYRRAELDRMWADIVDDEHGFAAARRAFLHKTRVAAGGVAVRL